MQAELDASNGFSFGSHTECMGDAGNE
jgi:hypothetical protein